MRYIKFIGGLSIALALCLSLCSCEAVKELIFEATARRIPPDNVPCDHIESEWITVSAPTCTKAGEIKTECTLCGEVLRTESVFAEHEYEFATVGKCLNCEVVRYSEGLEYSLDDQGMFYTVRGRGTCTDTDIVIPPMLGDYPVSAIFSNAFHADTSITSLTVTRPGFYIDPFSFTDCTSLRIVRLSDSVTVGAYCFDGCTSLKEVNIPKGTKIGGGAFRGCSPELKAHFEVSDSWLSGPIGYMGGSQLSESIMADPEKAGKYLLSTENFVWRKK